ncbi:hypothetical protein B0H19DRAFT_1160863 [Mycena capillaripes]|nr:hypothetical protein B0H19DRAFT_1160863 [Mycena capillaripes]
MNASAILRCRLQPQCIRTSNLPSRNSGFTTITAGQVLQATPLPVATHWSIALDLGDRLIEALEADLDVLLPQHPNLATQLSEAIHELQRQWTRRLGDDSGMEYDQLENATTAASDLLLLFGTDVFRAVRSLITNAPNILLKSRTKPVAGLFEIDHTMSLGGRNVMGMEDKRASLLPWAAAELSKRGLSCRVVEVERQTPQHQQNWWIIPNKGALYAAVYETDWVVFAGTTVYCVGYRIGDHMFWCPVYNRRDLGQEVDPNTPADLEAIFGADAPEWSCQTGLPLLVMAITLQGAKNSCPWLLPLFPTLFRLDFPIPSGTPDTREFSNHGRDLGDSSDESGSGSGSEGNDGDETGDFDGSPASFGDKSTRMTRSSGSTMLVSGQQKFTGNWLGELARFTGHSVHIRNRLSEGCHGIVYAAELVRNGKLISAVAVKISDDKHGLLTEFSRYEELKERMGPYLPQCYGICVASGTAFLITSLIHDHGPKHKLTIAERGAVYAALKRMHEGGWVHNDVVDPAKHVIHNVLWADTGRPVLIDLVTVSRHRCGKKCAELKLAKKALGLSTHEIAIWAR